MTSYSATIRQVILHTHTFEADDAVEARAMALNIVEDYKAHAGNSEIVRVVSYFHGTGHADFDVQVSAREASS